MEQAHIPHIVPVQPYVCLLYTSRFPRFADFAAEMKAQGIHLVPIIDAAVKVEDGYDVYEEGVKNGYFCTNQDGTPFVAVSYTHL